MTAGDFGESPIADRPDVDDFRQAIEITGGRKSSWQTQAYMVIFADLNDEHVKFA